MSDQKYKNHSSFQKRREKEEIEDLFELFIDMKNLRKLFLTFSIAFENYLEFFTFETLKVRFTFLPVTSQYARKDAELQK